MRLDVKRLTPLVLALAVYALDPSAFAQTFVTPRGEAQNVRVEQREDGIVHIFYDLISSDPRAVFAVRLEASQDGGTTFGLQPQSTSGDTGDGVRPGTGKRIVWDSGKDVERVQIDRFRFRIIATGAPLAADSPAKPAQPTPKVAAPPAQKGSGIKWLLIGGGAAAAAGVAVAAGGGGGGGTTTDPPVTTPAPPVTTPAVNRPPVISAVSSEVVGGPPGKLIAALTRMRFFVTVTDPDGDSMTANLNHGENNFSTVALTNGINDRYQIVDNVTYAGGTFTPSVTVTDSRGARSAAANYDTVVVEAMIGLFVPDPNSPVHQISLGQRGIDLSGTITFANGASLGLSGSVGNAILPTEARGITFYNGTETGCIWHLTGSSDLRTFTGSRLCNPGSLLPVGLLPMVLRRP